LTFSRVYATESQHKPWNIVVRNRVRDINAIPGFPRGDVASPSD
jgi:hypothetical protein